MFKLRDYQVDLSNKAVVILRKFSIVYFAVEVRCGKTLMSLNTAKLYGAKNVLFLTKKKAISSIKNDYNNFGYSDAFEITIINDESMHKVEGVFDLVIHDEHHRFGAFPKPGKYTKLFKELYSHLPMILLSGTPHPESFSQIYHQFWVSKHSPFEEKTFYKWAKNYVKLKQVNFGYGMVNDYSDADREKIYNVIGKYVLTFTQEQSGFKSKVNEHILYCEMQPKTYMLIDKLKKDLVIMGKNENIVADTAVKLMSKIYQISNGHVIFESGRSMIIDKSKAEFIKNRFEGKKIAIFYKFKKDYDILKKVYGDNLTDDLDEFNSTNKNVAFQFLSGREGVSLKKAEKLVFYNLDYSATTYFQSRDRMLTKDRLENNIYFIFTKKGLEPYIYKTLMNKKKYTTSVFKRDYLK